MHIIKSSLECSSLARPHTHTHILKQPHSSHCVDDISAGNLFVNIYYLHITLVSAAYVLCSVQMYYNKLSVCLLTLVLSLAFSTLFSLFFSLPGRLFVLFILVRNVYSHIASFIHSVPFLRTTMPAMAHKDDRKTTLTHSAHSAQSTKNIKRPERKINRNK